MITLEPSMELNEIYDKYTPRPHKPPGEADSKEARKAGKEDDTRLLISREAIPRITSLFSLPHIAVADMYRAMDQTMKRLAQ